MAQVIVDGSGNIDFSKLAEAFPKRVHKEESWYLVLISAFTTTGRSDLIVQLCKYLIKDKEPQKLKEIIDRINETFIKLTLLIGIPKVLEAVYHIKETVDEKYLVTDFTLENWTNGPENRKNALKAMQSVYSHQISKPSEAVLTQSDMHVTFKDIHFISAEIGYGMCHSRTHIVTLRESELIILTTLLLQRLPRESKWHLRGARRTGSTPEEVEGLQVLLESTLNPFLRIDLSGMPRCKDIENEL